MESNSDAEAAAEAIRVADRAEVAAWVDYPPTPRWYPIAVGAWTAAFVATLELPRAAWRVGAIVGLVVVEYAFVAWYRRYRGAWPSSTAPRELHRPMAWFAGGVAVVLAVSFGLALLLSPWLGAGVTLVGVTAIVAVYERGYAEAMAQTARRLG